MSVGFLFGDHFWLIKIHMVKPQKEKAPKGRFYLTMS